MSPKGTWFGMRRAKKRCSVCNRRLWRWESVACSRHGSQPVWNRVVKVSSKQPKGNLDTREPIPPMTPENLVTMGAVFGFLLFAGAEWLYEQTILAFKHRRNVKK